MVEFDVAGDAAGVLGRALGGYKPRLKEGGIWRASVALVLRWTARPPSNADDASEIPLRGFLERYAHNLELLFIQRAIRAADPWSGHIAFPGGRRDPIDENDLACAIRECREEVGITLDASTHYRYLGRLDDVRIPSRFTKRASYPVLCSFVFLQSSDYPPQPCVLDPHEVAAALWVPLACLIRGSPVQAIHVLHLRKEYMGLAGAIVPRAVLEALGLTRLLYVAVDVFPAATEVIYAVTNDPSAREDAIDSHTSLTVGEELELDTGSVLWGLTMRAASDMVGICGGVRLDRPPFVVDNKFIAAISRAVCTFVWRLRWLCQFRFRRSPYRISNVSVADIVKPLL